ncbi:MAG: hypothetical protein RRY64_02080 [Oscillospiraceae bacterium]
MGGAPLGDGLDQKALLPLIGDGDADAHIVVGAAEILGGKLLRGGIVGPAVPQGGDHAGHGTVQNLFLGGSAYKAIFNEVQPLEHGKAA